MNQHNILVFNPEIAKEIGVNESIILQQLNYWHKKYNLEKWIYNSYDAWQEQFYFWSTRTIRRIFLNLEKMGFIQSKRSKDHKSYRLSDTAIKKFFSSQKWPSCPSREAKLASSYNKETKNTHKISSYKKKGNNFKTQKKEVSFRTTDKNDGEIHNTVSIEVNQEKVEQMILIWNELFEFSLKPIQAFSNKNIVLQLNNILKNKLNNDLENWRLYAKKVNSSKFLMGEKETKNNFKAEFSWLIKNEVVDAILQGAYGVGDRSLDSDMLEDNIKTCEKEVKQELKNKVSKYLEQKVSLEKEEKEFKSYVLSREFKKDGDMYGIGKHMEEVGKQYMYGEYITASHIFYPGQERYKRRIFNSYLMKKYCGIDETVLDNEINSSFKKEPNKIELFKTMKNIKNKISNCDVLLSGGAKHFQRLVGLNSGTTRGCV